MPTARKYEVIRPLEKFVVNPPVRLAWRLGVGPRGDALLETIGRRSGRPQLTPICDGSEGDTFWLVVQHGRRADYVRNIEVNPRVRVRPGARAGWRTGMAHIFDDDDPIERIRLLGQRKTWRRLCLDASRAMSTDLLTVRIDLEASDKRPNHETQDSAV